jgi:hypothetical protein
MTIAALATGAFIVMVILIWNVQRVLSMRLTAIQTELGEVNLAVLELFKMALEANRRADLKAEPAKSSGGEIPNEDPHNASGLEAELDEVDTLCAKLITLVAPANAVPLLSEKESLERTVSPLQDRKLLREARTAVVSPQPPVPESNRLDRTEPGLDALREGRQSPNIHAGSVVICNEDRNQKDDLGSRGERGCSTTQEVEPQSPSGAE